MRIAVLTGVAAVVATSLNYAIQEIVRQAFAVPAAFEPFHGTVFPYTIGGIVLAGVTYALMRRFMGDWQRTYLVIAIVALVLSWIPDVALLVIDEPGATIPAVLALMTMHAVAAASVVGLLLRFEGPSGSRAPRAATR
jgi:hypothetical protein